MQVRFKNAATWLAFKNTETDTKLPRRQTVARDPNVQTDER